MESLIASRKITEYLTERCINCKSSKKQYGEDWKLYLLEHKGEGAFSEDFKIGQVT